MQPLLQYPDLNTDVFQVFRVVGNTLLLVTLFEHSVDIVDVLDHQLVELFAKYQSTMRSAVFPSAEALQNDGKPLGFNIQGGREHGQPIIISKVLCLA